MAARLTLEEAVQINPGEKLIFMPMRPNSERLVELDIKITGLAQNQEYAVKNVKYENGNDLNPRLITDVYFELEGKQQLDLYGFRWFGRQ
ncbi:hypothetical protein HY498_05280 [Candidatus Woesearchaeota archaeon]|nr:hypothetical protein [Candidatus Woesearchaeota archaeon]